MGGGHPRYDMKDMDSGIDLTRFVAQPSAHGPVANATPA